MAQLTEEQLQQLREVFATDRAIASVAIARKQVKIFPESPAFVVSLKIKIPFLSVRADTSLQSRQPPQQTISQLTPEPKSHLT